MNLSLSVSTTVGFFLFTHVCLLSTASPQSLETGNDPCYADECPPAPLAEQKGSVAGCVLEETSETFPPLGAFQKEQEQEQVEGNERRMQRAKSVFLF